MESAGRGRGGGGGRRFKVRREMKVDRGPRKRANARGASERGNHERGANAPFFDRECGAAKPLLPFFFGPKEKNESASLLGRQQQNDRRRRGQAKARSRTRAGCPCASTLANARSARRSTLPTASQNLIRIVARRRGVCALLSIFLAFATSCRRILSIDAKGKARRRQVGPLRHPPNPNQKEERRERSSSFAPPPTTSR